MEEIWESIPNFDDYYMVSNFGRVKSINRIIQCKNGVKKNRKGRILCPRINKQGYLRVHLSRSAIAKDYFIHLLVALLFVENSDNKPEVNHKDGDKLNNHFENLEWVTKSENQEHARETGLNKVRGETHHTAKLKNYEVIDIYNSNLQINELASKYNVLLGTIANIKRGSLWSHLTGAKYIRKYLTKEQVMEIFNSELNYKELALKYNIKRNTVSQIKTGAKWSKLTGKIYKGKNAKFDIIT